jgi:MFS family permease
MIAMPRLTFLSPLRHRPFRLLFLGQVISNLGDWLNLLALSSLLLYRWNLGAGAWGGVLIALTLPSAILGPAAGVWVDRWPRKPVMIAADLARAAVVLGLVVAPNLPTVLALVATASAFATFFDPAKQAVIRATVPDDDLMTANGLSQLSSNSARLVGPALGGLLVVVAGPRGAFAVDALSFLASAAILSRLPAPAPQAAPIEPERRYFWGELRDGLRHLASSRPLAVTVAATVAASFLTRATDTLGLNILKALGVGEGLVGVSFAVLGLGYVVGALAVGQWGDRLAPLAVMGGARAAVGAVYVCLGVAVIAGLGGGAATFLAAYPLRLLLGLGFAAMTVGYGTVLMRETPPDLMGRVTATTGTLQNALPLAAPLLATALADWWGLGITYAATGGLYVAVGVLPLLVTARSGKTGVVQTTGVGEVGERS